MTLSAIKENGWLLASLRFALLGLGALAFAIALFLGWKGVLSGLLAFLTLAGGLFGLGLALPRPAKGEVILSASSEGLRLYPPHVVGAVPTELVMWSEIDQIAVVQHRTMHHLVITFTPEGARRLALRPATWQPSVLMRGLTGPKARCRVSVLPIPVPELVAALNAVSVAQGVCLYPSPTLMDSHWQMAASNDSVHQG